MAKIEVGQNSWIGGIADSSKSGIENSFAFGRGIDHRTDPSALTIAPQALKDSGSVVTDLPMWGVRSCDNLWFYGNTGSIYKNASGTWSKEHTAGSSTGNGLAYFGEDDNLYYTQNTTIGRLTKACDASGDFKDDFLGQEGGAPTNTHSLDLEADSSQYDSRADTSSLSITGDISLEAYVKHESLPSTGNTMTYISKWEEDGATRSYKMDLSAASNFFGDGSDGALTISSNTTEAPIDSTAVGTSGTTSLTATNASFAAGQKILIHQTRGTNAGTYQLTEISSYTAGTITTADTLDVSYNSTGDNKAQVRVLKQHTNVTINSGVTYTAKAWDDSNGVGGILGFFANGTVTITGNITANGTGFAGGAGATGVGDVAGFDGEGTDGASTQEATTLGLTSTNNGSGGGGGTIIIGGDSAGGGGGGGNGTVGISAVNVRGAPGDTSGSSDLTTMTFGGGGGSGGDWDSISGDTTGAGGNGGGILTIFGATIATITGTVTSSGGNGGTGFDSGSGGSGGAGGSILFKAQTAPLGTVLVTALGGAGGTQNGGTNGGAGGDGRIHIDYLTSFSGTTNPTLTSAQDDNLGTGDGYDLRLLVSSTGSNSEIYTWDVSNDVSTGTWLRWHITWDSSASTAKFYKNGVLLGTKVGSLTAIHDNASVFYVGADKNNAGNVANFYDGLIDDVRVWNDVRTASELLSKNNFVLLGTEINLIAYYKLDNDHTDSQTSGNNDLTASGSPSFSTDVPFSGLTSRNDEDQKLETSGQTYTLTTAINEGATHRQTFVPTRDPQKSVEVLIAAVGTGDWTLTVHDAQNNEQAALTVTNGELLTGDYDFVFATPWRPVIDASYHFHITSTVADGTVTTTTNADLETVDFHTYFGFLVSDVYHPILQILNILAIGNERYISTWNASTYTPHKLTLPSGYRIRSLAYWREYLAIGVWRTADTTPTIKDEDQGFIFFWDGASDTYNYFIPVPEGGINAMYGTSDILYALAGYSGDLIAYTGGGSAQKIKRMPNITNDKFMEIAPGSMNMWKTLLRIGLDFSTDSTSIEKGVYSYGTLNRNYPFSLGFEHPLSLGTQTGTGVNIGCVFPSGQALYVGWQNSNSFGIDKIAVGNDPYTDASVELLISDMSTISEDKYPITIRADFEPLIDDQTMKIKYKANRASAWSEKDINNISTDLAIEDTAGAKNVRLPVTGTIANELQVAIDLGLTATSVVSPKLTGITVEERVGEGTDI